MSPENKTMARRQLDRRLNKLRNADEFARPSRGWIRAIREALGMTTAQLGKRMGVSQPRIIALEKAEASKTITLDTLERAAQALGCNLVYVLVPHQPLEDMITERAHQVARQRLAPTRHSMALEAQGVEAKENKDQLERLARSLAEKSASNLWDVE